MEISSWEVVLSFVTMGLLIKTLTARGRLGYNETSEETGFSIIRILRMRITDKFSRFHKCEK